MGCTIIGSGKYLPELEIQNDDLKALVDTDDEWISSRTGIKSRHIAVKETGADLGEAAARCALGWEEGGYTKRRIEPTEIDLLICVSVSPDAVVPSVAGLLRRRLGLTNCIAFDMNAACTGFTYAVTIAEAMMAASANDVAGAVGRNAVRHALVVGAERLSRNVDWYDRNTCVLIGDGAGAAVLEWDESRPGILSSILVNEDDLTGALSVANSFDAPQPFNESGVTTDEDQIADPSLDNIDAELCITESVRAGMPRQALRMDGQQIFKFATRAIVDCIHEVLEKANLTIDDIACIVPHQANERIIKYAAKKLGLPLDFFQLSLDHMGNISSASIPIALCDAYTSGRIKPGDKVILMAFGGGLTCGAILYEA